MRENTLFYGDNLDVLREHVRDESVDLVYLDPPFQSGKDYNLIFRTSSGSAPPAQVKAFADTWNGAPSRSSCIAMSSSREEDWRSVSAECDNS